MVFFSSFMLHFRRENNKHVNQPSVVGRICYTRNYTLEKVRKLYDHWRTSESYVLIFFSQDNFTALSVLLPKSIAQLH